LAAISTDPPLRETRLSDSPRGWVSRNDRVTKGDPSDGDYDPIARYEQGAMIVLFIFAAAFLALIIWLGWMIL
jgi:hypothetical protein